MTGSRNCWVRCAAVLGLAALAGCKHGTASRPAPTLGAGGEPPVHLTAAQVADMRVALGRTLEQRGELEQAGRTYAGALEKDPKRADACVRLANVHARQGQFAEATALYGKALELEPRNADVYCNLGYTQYLREQWDEAEWALRKCLSLKPDHKRAHNNLGLVLARQGKAEEALAEFRLAGCSDNDGRLNLAYARTLDRDWPGARQQYQKVLATDPSSDAARKGLERVEGLARRLGETGDGRAVASRPTPAGEEAQPLPRDAAVVPAKAEGPGAKGLLPAGGGRPAAEKPWVPGPLPKTVQGKP